MLEIRNATKSYTAGDPVLHSIDLTVAVGDIVCLLGPSGCGKTTLLRAVAGLEQLDSGQIFFDGVDLAPIEIHKRNFGLMFQEFALFPHKNVGQNIAFGLRMANWSAAEINKRISEMLDLVNLQGYAKRSIFELSGGERQRVALARSLAPSPRLLMLDEPLGSLDRSLREELMTELRIILKEVGVTALYVTHDQEEAFAIADQIVLLNGGEIEQSGPPAQIYAYPDTEFTARFLGFHNLLATQIHAADPAVAATPIGPITLPQPASPGSHTLLIRPDALTLLPAPQPDTSSYPEKFRTTSPRSEMGQNFSGELYSALHTGIVHAASFRGDHVRVQLEISADVPRLLVHFPLGLGKPEENFTIGERLYFQIDPMKVSLLASAE